MARDKTLKVDLVDPVRHDGEHFPAGSEGVELPAAAAQSLLDGGYALPAGTLAARRAEAEAAAAAAAAEQPGG